MAGHSKWAQIKHQKSVVDQKRGALFSKLLRSVSVAAERGLDPAVNSQLRAAIEKARAHNVPQDTIRRAVTRARDGREQGTEMLLEAYGPEGVALLIEARTDNTNRTIAEIKQILHDHGGKWGEEGSVRWLFRRKDGNWEPKFYHELSLGGRSELKKLLEVLEVHDDVRGVTTNFKP
ncbi:MAG: YebC/PmpR family DNA-binding transcriptional regulator [Candidatus Liptonbacteria bacterium]|nr:YebC/PmpR family DNA-binding transcriptional regulator [Candidatus Liptonbacteria bacterium]